nr:MAG TPA: hypothetical protein [Caudoviricetes sp.]
MLPRTILTITAPSIPQPIKNSAYFGRCCF